MVFPPPHSQAKMLPDAYSCAVANRFGDLLDDDEDPFDLISKVETEKEKNKKKRDDDKKGKQKKPGQKESQKDRRVPKPADAQAPVPGKLVLSCLPCHHTGCGIQVAASISGLRGSAKSGQSAQALSASDCVWSAKLLSTCAGGLGGCPSAPRGHLESNVTLSCST